MAIVALVYLASQLAEPYPGVGPFAPLVGWQVPGESTEDPQALAILEIARSSEQLGDRPLWLRETDIGVLLITTGMENARGIAEEALAGTPVNTNRIEFYPGSYAFLFEDAEQSFRQDPIAFIDSLRGYLPWVLSISGLGFVFAGWWLRRKRPVEGWDRPPRDRPAIQVTIGLGVMVGLASLAVARIVELATVAVLGIDTIELSFYQLLADSGGIVLGSFIFLGVFIAPLGEELFFRGHIFRWSADRCGLAFAYGVSAILFALIHGNPPGIPSYVAAAVILAWSYERWRTLAVPMVAHGTYNLIAISLMALS